MNYIQINKFSKIPLYIQLKNSIKNAILNGVLKDKDKLPTEDFIGQVFNVSRPVVRQAYQSLIEEGLITRQQGKGTFVKKQLNFSNIFFKKNFNEEILLKGFQPNSQFISLEIIDAKSLPTFNLEIPDYAQYYLLKRIRKADDIPIVYEIFFFPTHLFKNMESKISNEMSLTKMVVEDYAFSNLLGECLISAVELDDPIANILKVNPGSVAIKFDILHTNRNHIPVFFKLAYFPGERNCIDVDIKGDDNELH